MTSSRRTVLVFVAALACVVSPGAAPAPAQEVSPDERHVIATVQALLGAIATCDAAAARAVTVPEGRLYRVTPGGRAGQGPRSSTFEEFTTSLAACKDRMLERMWAPQVRVHKDIASVWAPYDFWIAGTFSHCGIDSFELARTNGAWVITGGIYTVEREGCSPSPLGPPSFPRARDGR